MRTVRHIFSESGLWKTESVFITPGLEEKHGSGESRITVLKDRICNESWTNNGDLRLRNEYRISYFDNNRYLCKSENAVLGNQYGWMDIHNNVVFSKYLFEDSVHNGYEVITREGDTAHVVGALYRDNLLINTWTAVMTKVAE